MEMSSKIAEFLIKYGCTDLIHPWVIDSTQLERASSVIN